MIKCVLFLVVTLSFAFAGCKFKSKSSDVSDGLSTDSITPKANSIISYRPNTGGYAHLLLGEWIDVKDLNSRIVFNGKEEQEMDSLGNTIGESVYYLFGSKKDSLAVILHNDTLLYYISSLDRDNLNLKYRGLLRSSYVVNILSYRKGRSLDELND